MISADFNVATLQHVFIWTRWHLQWESSSQPVAFHVTYN